MEKGKCKYCGRTIKESSASKTVCCNCQLKLQLVRKLLQMVRDTYEKSGRGTQNGRR